MQANFPMDWVGGCRNCGADFGPQETKKLSTSQACAKTDGRKLLLSLDFSSRGVVTRPILLLLHSTPCSPEKVCPLAGGYDEMLSSEPRPDPQPVKEIAHLDWNVRLCELRGTKMLLYVVIVPRIQIDVSKERYSSRSLLHSARGEANRGHEHTENEISRGEKYTRTDNRKVKIGDFQTTVRDRLILKFPREKEKRTGHS